MLSLKAGVSLYGIKPEMMVAVIVVNDIMADEGYETVLTSVTDGTHGKGSYHPLGYAFDVRTTGVGVMMSGAKAYLVAKRIREALGSDFDVVVEDDHMHIEYDLNKVRGG